MNSVKLLLNARRLCRPFCHPRRFHGSKSKDEYLKKAAMML